MNTHQYARIPEERMKHEVARVCNWAKEFVEQNGYDFRDLSVSQIAVYQMITKVDQRKQYFNYFHHLNISDLKEIALYAFWIVKLMPLQYKESDFSGYEQALAFESINPKFAAFLIIKKFKSLAENQAQRNRIDAFFSYSYVYELIYSLTYRDISKEALILLVETMALALGFKPYQEG